MRFVEDFGAYTSHKDISSRSIKHVKGTTLDDFIRSTSTVTVALGSIKSYCTSFSAALLNEHQLSLSTLQHSDFSLYKT